MIDLRLLLALRRDLARRVARWTIPRAHRPAIDLLHPRIPRVGLLLRRPSLAREAHVTTHVQLFRPVPGIGLVPAPMLHRPGYQATPEKVAPLCSEGGGPYGRLVWIWTGRPPPHRLCPKCEDTAD